MEGAMRRFAVPALVMVVLLAAVSAAGAAALPLEGVMGRLVAVERVVEPECRSQADDGHCAFVAVQRGLDHLRRYMEHFRCTDAGGVPDIRVWPEYAPMTKHDSGPAVIVEARSLRCEIDPRHELALVERAALKESCSQLTWKCTLVWIPDEDPTIALIGSLEP
jgi:hypothetical protein